MTQPKPVWWEGMTHHQIYTIVSDWLCSDSKNPPKDSYPCYCTPGDIRGTLRLVGYGYGPRWTVYRCHSCHTVRDMVNCPSIFTDDYDADGKICSKSRQYDDDEPNWTSGWEAYNACRYDCRTVRLEAA